MDDYVILDGLRYARPYMFDYFAHVKTRWCGMSLINLFLREFKGRSRDYYERAVTAGRLRVEETSMSARGAKRKAQSPPGGCCGDAAGAESARCAALWDAPLRDGQRVRHLVHRHEPPVLAAPLAVLAVTEAAVVLCKPASMPVHPTGQYRKNSVLGLFASQHGTAYGRLCPVHRLDRNVSGLLLFARGPAHANALRLLICAGDVCKEYVTLVRGAFPDGPPRVVDAPLRYDYATRRTLVGDAPGAKPAATALRLLACSADGALSLLAVRPLTGRTHQIRAHCQHAGFPVANDALYGGTAAAAAVPASGGPLAAGEPDALCSHCPWLAPQGESSDVEALNLHACRYSSAAGEGWRFEAPLPDWAAALLLEGALPEGLWDSLSDETLRRYHDQAAPGADIS